MSDSKISEYVDADGTRWTAEALNEPSVDMARLKVSNGHRAMIFGKTEGSNGPEYYTHLLLSPEDWEKHKEAVRRLALMPPDHAS